MATKASRIALAGSNISSTGEVDADLLDNIDSAAFLSLDGNDRLGIGTASADSRLHIKAGDSGYGGGIQIEDTDSSTKSAITHVDGTLYVSSNSTADHLAVESSGNVKVLHSLEVNRGVYGAYQALNLENTNGNTSALSGVSLAMRVSGGLARIDMYNSSNTNTDSSELLFKTGDGGTATERMRIDAGGTVSIQSLPGTTSSGISGASGGSLDLNGGTAFAGRLLLTGYNDSGSNLIGLNNESSGLVMYDYTDSQYIMKTNNDQKVSFGGGFPNVNGSSNGVYNIVVDDGICIGDGGYTHGYVGTNGTDGDVYIAANAYPANVGADRSVRIAAGSSGGGGPNEIVRYNHSHGAIRNYNNNTTTNKKWWSTTSGNFGEVEEYDYGNKLYFKKTRAVGGYTQMLLLNRYMPNQYDVSFELVSPLDTVTYRHFGIALNHVGSETTNFDYLVLRQRFGSSAQNQVRIDRPAGTVGDNQGSHIPNFHDGTKRKIMIQKRASTFRMQVHELNGSVYTYGTITGISWTNSSGYFGFGIYESTGTNTWAKISNLTITDVIA